MSSNDSKLCERYGQLFKGNGKLAFILLNQIRRSNIHHYFLLKPIFLSALLTDAEFSSDELIVFLSIKHQIACTIGLFANIQSVVLYKKKEKRQ